MAKKVTDPALLAQLNATSTVPQGGQGRGLSKRKKVTDPAVLAALNAPQAGAGPADYAVQGLSGANEGLAMTLGTPVDLLNSIVIGPAMAGINAVAGTDFKPAEKPFLGSESIKGMMGGAIAPETDDAALQMTRRVGQEFGAAAPVVGGLAAKAAQPIRMLAAEAGLTAGSGAGAAAAEQISPDNPWAELAGQITGFLGAGAVAKGVRKAITPFEISPARQTAADTMKKEGVELTAGQQTGSKGLQYAESELGGARIAKVNESQAEQFTTAILKRAGISGKRATPQVLDDAFDRIGQEFDDLASNNTLTADQQMAADLRDTWQEYSGLLNETTRAPIVEKTIREIADAIRNNGGQIPGDVYAELRSRLERFARKASDPELADALRGIKAALDDTVERGMVANNSPDLGKWQEVRHNYRNMLVVERAAQGGGENAAMGLISPAQLRQATQAIYGKRSYVRGKDDFAELAQAGQATMTPLPQSGTAPRLAARALSSIPAAVGAAAGAPGGIPGMVGGALVGAAVPSIAGRALLSPMGRRYLANRALQMSPTTDPRGVGPVSAAIASQSNALANRGPGNVPGRLMITVPYGGLASSP